MPEQSKVFKSYSNYYDLIYQDKDYKGECDFIEEILGKYSSKPVTTILDAGCGTGGHAIPLARRGYRVTGIDASGAMVEIAKEKIKKANAQVTLHVRDMRNFSLGQKFDAAICMFNVIGYLLENRDLQAALANIRSHLASGSLFVFDCWHGPAVLRILPSVRVKTIKDSGKTITRIAEPELDIFHHLCKVHYRLFITRNSTLIDEIKETHISRYLFPQEIVHYLEDAHFELVKMCPFLDLKGKMDENTWNITVIARAKAE